MTVGRIFYRVRQARQAVRAKPQPEDLELARSILSDGEFELFSRLLQNEQAHSIEVLNKLINRGVTEQQAWTAALLHDTGKSCYPLSIFERIWIVLVRAIFPKIARRWGKCPGYDRPPRDGLPGVPFWQRPLIVAEQHPAWGAEMAAEVGASDLVVAIIRRHQEPGVDAGSKLVDFDNPNYKPADFDSSNEEHLLLLLQEVDENS